MEDTNDPSSAGRERRKRMKLIGDETPEEEVLDKERLERQELVSEFMKKHEANKAQLRRERNEVRFFIVLKITVSIALLLAINVKFPYGYYIFLRWFVCASATFYTYFYYKKRISYEWLIASAAVAILFNPFVPVYLSRDSWGSIDSLLIGIILISALFDYTQTKN